MSNLHQISIVGRDRISDWQCAVHDATAVKVVCEPGGSGEFGAAMRGRALGQGAVAEMRTASAHYATTSPTSRNSGALILMPRSGPASLTIDGEEVRLQQLDIVLIDAGRKFTLLHDASASLLVQCVPFERLRRAAHRNDLQLFKANQLNGLFADFLEGVLRLGALDARTSDLLLEKAVELFLIAIANQAPISASHSQSRGLLLKRAKLVVESRLNDPSLSPSSLAGELGISAAYLHALFHDSGVSPMRFVMERRLDKARLELSQPALSGGNISEIAFRWGFESLSHFSRSFRQRFGVSPRDLQRRQAYGADPDNL